MFCLEISVLTKKKIPVPFLSFPLPSFKSLGDVCYFFSVQVLWDVTQCRMGSIYQSPRPAF